jgi:Tfp pilus assembly major pilin PilA
VKILASLVVVFFIAGIVAAIALPAYSDYAKRARAVQTQ